MKKLQIITVFLLLSGYYTFLWADENKPRALKAIPGNGVVYLSWSSPKNEAIGYLVYRALFDEKYQQLNDDPIEITFYKDNNVVNGEAYSYMVTAIDGNGNQGHQSVTVTIVSNGLSGAIGGY